MNVQMLLKKAIEETKKLKTTEEFLLKDLFKGYEWKRIPLSNRLLLGTLFLNHIKLYPNISAIEKTSSKQQKYKII